MALGAMLLYGVVAFPVPTPTSSASDLGLLRLPRMARRAMERNGMEVIQMGRDGLELRMDHGTKQGRLTKLPLADLAEAVVPEPNPRSLLESMEQQFWVVGGDRIHLSANGKTYVFGKQLELRDAQQLAKAFNQRLKRLKKSSP